MAIGLAITTKNAKRTPFSQFGISCPFFRSLLPSFCKTASMGYEYRFYLGYDNNDTRIYHDTGGVSEDVHTQVQTTRGGSLPTKIIVLYPVNPV